MPDFLREQFDKLLLASTLIGFCALAAMNGQLAGFGTDAAKTILGALLGLITGHALADRTPPSSGGAV